MIKSNSTFILLLSLNFLATSSASAEGGAETQIKKSLKNASKAVNLPDARSVVFFGQQEAIVLSDNPRWVVKGQLFDMWQNIEINSSYELKQAAKKIPINTIKINTDDVIDTRVRPEKESLLTVFLDPFASDSPEVVRLLNTYATDYQVRYIFTAMSQKHIAPFFDFACQSQGLESKAISQLVITQSYTQTNEECLQEEAMNSFGLTQFLHISKSPTLISPNETYHVGLPSNLMAWLKENEL